jgi:hypothetical protein
MPDFNVRSDSVNVEQIMEQIRARIREKRGVDYTEQQIRELAAVKLEKFLDPRGVRSDLLNEFRRSDPEPNYSFEDDTLFQSTRSLVQGIRRLLQPILKLFFNPNPLIHVLHLQAEINARNAAQHQLYYELIHNLVVETTRLGIEVKNLKVRVESLDARVDFNERRARALEGAVIYRSDDEEPERVSARPASAPPGAQAPLAASGTVPASIPEGAGQRSKRRRRRRGRRGGAPAASIMGPQGGPQPQRDSPPVAAEGEPPRPVDSTGAGRPDSGASTTPDSGSSASSDSGGSGSPPHSGTDDQQ